MVPAKTAATEGATDVRFGQKRTCSAKVDVRFNPKADICGARGHTRLIPESGHRAAPNCFELDRSPI